MENKVVLITGAGKRVGAVIAQTLHQAGMNLMLHYRGSQSDAEQLCQQLNQSRANSAAIVQADLSAIESLPHLVETTVKQFGRLDVLINNASSFYPTLLGDVNLKEWQDLFATNVQAPFFLAQAALPYLKKSQGNIINMVDIHADRPLKDYSVYCMAKAALQMMTKSLAKDLGPTIRVNGVAPGVIMWPDEAMPEKAKDSILKRVALQRAGEPQNVADTILFLLRNDYITGQIIAVDGGRSLSI